MLLWGFFFYVLFSNQFSVFTWPRNSSQVGVPAQSSRNWTLLFLWKHFLLFSLTNTAVDQLSENQEYPNKHLRLHRGLQDYDSGIFWFGVRGHHSQRKNAWPTSVIRSRDVCMGPDFTSFGAKNGCHICSLSLIYSCRYGKELNWTKDLRLAAHITGYHRQSSSSQ